MTKFLPKKAVCVVCLVAMGLTVEAQAHDWFVTIDGEKVVLSKNVNAIIFPSNTFQDAPKLWRDMSAKERAELWPYLSRPMQRRYWLAMSDNDRLAMRKEFTLYQKELMKNRYISPSNIKERQPILGATVCHDQMHQHLSAEERHMMREQIRQMHAEMYRFRTKMQQDNRLPPP